MLILYRKLTKNRVKMAPQSTKIKIQGFLNQALPIKSLERIFMATY